MCFEKELFMLPCHSPSASRGRTEKSVSWDQNCSRPKQKTTTAEQLTHTQQTEQILAAQGKGGQPPKCWTNAWQGAVGKENKCYQHAPTCHWHRQHVW